MIPRIKPLNFLSLQRKILVGGVLAVLLSARVRLSSQESSYYIKVPSLMSETEDLSCLLKTFDPLVANTVTCGSLCEGHEMCFGFCLVGSNSTEIRLDSNTKSLFLSEHRCALYSTSISLSWKGSKVVEGKCYSRWAHPRDLALKATATGNSYSTDYPASYAIDGYYCKQTTQEGTCFWSENAKNSWWLADLGDFHPVSSIRVRLYRSTTSYFRDIEVKVGNRSSEGDFSSFEFLARSSGEEVSSVVITLKAKNPLVGRFVSIQTLVSNFLVLCEVQILPATVTVH
ncbi:uncharacterized protein LOC143020519 [Oratosquilla oratoria]|uniref:uncharacterized protein LOC143020519 n=1 Tax=Oratosquilla oratoria TaxID=337810 RepID=UPI003F75E016